jgi:hypothetical protein
MAGKALKDLAKANIVTLTNLHIGGLFFNLLFLVFLIIFRSRSLVLYLVLSIPALACQYILESTGRPKYVTANGKSTLKGSGQDLSAQGLTEYMFDVIWVTWACLVMVIILGDKGWFLYAVVLGFAGWKGWGLLGAARGMMGGGQGQEGMQEQAAEPQNRRQRRKAAA